MDERNPDAAARKKERQREYSRQWYLKNREKSLERARQRRADPEKRAAQREYQRKWAQENREKVRESRRRWRQANPDKVRAEQARYRSYHRDRYYENRNKWRDQGRKRRHGVDPAAFLAMWEAQQRCCYLCGRELDPDDAHIDHWHDCPAHDERSSCSRCHRGLVHGACNAVIGFAGDDPDLLRIIADSLEAANAEVQAQQFAAAEQLKLL
jgi:hypothetical protein